MIVKQVRLSQQAKEQLSRLKGKTGISNWNVLCRWAICISFAEPTRPPDIDIVTDSNVEMSWHVFAGEYHELYEALMVQRIKRDGLDADPETLARQFKLHLHRGIAYLSASSFIKSIDALATLAVRAYGRQ